MHLTREAVAADSQIDSNSETCLATYRLWMSLYRYPEASFSSGSGRVSHVLPRGH